MQIDYPPEINDAEFDAWAKRFVDTFRIGELEIQTLNVTNNATINQYRLGQVGSWDISENTLSNGTITLNSAQNNIVVDTIVLDGAENEIRIGGTNIVLDADAEQITVGVGIEIDGANNHIRSTNYVSGSAGAGFNLASDILEVGSIAARGIIRTSVFQKGIISAMGGNLWIRPADVLNADMTADDSSPLAIEGNETFAVGDFLRIKDETNDEWFEVTNTGSAPTYTVTRDKAAQYSADANPAWKKGASVVNFGQSGDGGIYLTSSESNAPYIKIYDQGATPWSGLTTRCHLGNLNGVYGFAADTYGIGIGDSNLADNYLTYDDASGNLVIKGSITVSGGDIVTDSRFGNALTENNSTSIKKPSGASLSNDSPTQDGAIKITLPQSWTSTMMQFIVDVYNYHLGGFSLQLGGYNNSGSSRWFNTVAHLKGSVANNNRVRFGHDGTYCCVVIGDETDTAAWDYVKVQVRDFVAGFQNFSVDEWDDGWSISLITSVAGITFTDTDHTDSLLDASAIVDQGALATENNLDGVPDGSTYARVNTTAISGGKIVLTGNGVTGTLATTFTSAKCTDALADQTSANSQDLDWIDGTSGTLTISSSGNLAISAANGLSIESGGDIEIKSGGDVIIRDGGLLKLEAGGDISLFGDITDPAEFSFYDTASNLASKIVSNTSNYTQWLPAADSQKQLYLGNSSTRFDIIRLYSDGQTDIYCWYDANNYSWINLDCGNSTNNELDIRVNSGGSENVYRFDTGAFHVPAGSATVGTSSNCFTNIYGDAGVTSCSDSKYKTDIAKERLGLNFINSIVPVTYSWCRSGKRPKDHAGTYHGFIAPEIEVAVNELGYDSDFFAGVEKSQDEEGENWYGLMYDQLLAPIVRAIQELNQKVEALE